MNDLFFHLTGACGEHWHPNLINVTILCVVAAYFIKRAYANEH